jgi:hypothetical protein
VALMLATIFADTRSLNAAAGPAMAVRALRQSEAGSVDHDLVSTEIWRIVM